MKTVVITGGCGFLGHHVIEHFLKRTTWNIVNIDGLTYAGKLDKIYDLACYKENQHRIRFVWHDLRAPIDEFLDNRIGSFDYVIHLAAASHVQNSITDSMPFVTSNVLGTTHLLNWLKTKKFEKFINFSTDEVFGPCVPEEGFIEFSEGDRFRPGNPYAASKCGQESIAHSYYITHKVPLITTRCTNLYGERQHIEKLIPLIISNIILKRKTVLHGFDKDTTALRIWIHCREIADGLLFLLKHGEIGKYYHFAGEQKSIYEIYKIICNAMKKEGIIEFKNPENCRPGHDFSYGLQDNNLKALGWTSNLKVETSITSVAKWSINYKNRKWIL